MYAVYNHKIYVFVDSFVTGRYLSTRKKEKTDASFYKKRDTCYVKQLDDLEALSDIYDIYFYVTYADPYFSDISKWEVFPQKK